MVVSLLGFAGRTRSIRAFEFAKIGDYVQNHAVLRMLHRILLHKYYIDELYDLLIRYGVLGLSHVEQAFDTYIVDGIVNGVARLVTTLWAWPAPC